MLISSWSDKGGVGKTTFAVQGISYLNAKVLDLDHQGDIARWAAKAGRHCEQLDPEQARERLVQAALDDNAIWWADCHPGGKPTINLVGMAFAQIVVVPVRGGGDQDVSALGRCIETVKQIRQAGNPGLRVAVVFNAAREITRDKNTADALRTLCLGLGETFLGTMKLRNGYPDAYTMGKSVFEVPGAAVDEMTTIMSNLAAMIPASLLPQHAVAHAA